MTRIDRIIYQVGKERGANAEERVGGALNFLIKTGEMDCFIRSHKLDSEGIDFCAQVGSKKYKLSVKSSLRGIAEDKEFHPERHRRGDIIFVIPNQDESQETLSNRILLLIKQFEENIHNS